MILIRFIDEWLIVGTALMIILYGCCVGYSKLTGGSFSLTRADGRNLGFFDALGFVVFWPVSSMHFVSMLAESIKRNSKERS